MAIIYLTEQGSILRKRSRRLVIEKEKDILLQIPDFKVDRVLVFGNVQITTQAMAFLLDNGIEVSFLSFYGKYRGRLTPVESKNAQLRIQQYKKHLDEEFRASFSKALVAAKLYNGRALIMRYARNHPEINMSGDTEAMEGCIQKLEKKCTLKSFMGIEGAAAAIYFKAFGKILRKKLKFKSRQRLPPKDPVNALLSLGYTLIGNEMYSQLSAIGCDPYVGFFHSIRYGRPSLALDLIEPFRHAVIDRFTLYLINNSVITEKDFDGKVNEGVLLNNSSIKRYFKEYEGYMTREVKSNLSTKHTRFRDLFKRQALGLYSVLGDRGPFVPYKMVD